MNIIRMAANIAMTPPSLLGIDRRIAYAQRKYHSGMMCSGVTRGLAWIKFSGSVRRFGEKRAIAISERKNATNPTRSFVV